MTFDRLIWCAVLAGGGAFALCALLILTVGT